jgi:HEAT repeat protein
MDLDALRAAIASGDPSRSMPALAALREATAEQAEPLLLLGLEQSAFMVRSLSCAGLGMKPTPAGWQALVQALHGDDDANVRAEAANALVSHSLERAWPLLLEAFERDSQWLVRCSILSAVAEQPQMPAADLLQLARLAIADGDGTVRVGGAEILGRLVHEGAAAGGAPWAQQARAELVALQHDSDHRVVAAALNGLQG